MKNKRVVYVVIALVMLAGLISVDAEAQNAYIANEPWGTAIVDSLTDGDVGSHVSIAYYEKGRAYVSYYDATNSDLKLAHQVTPGTGNCGEKDDWKCEVIDGTDDKVGMYSSIDVRTGYHKPFFPLTSEVSPNITLQVAYPNIGISYYDETNKALKYAEYTCDDNSCGWWIETVEDYTGLFSNAVGFASSFDFGTNGIPIIAYQYREPALIPDHGSGVRRAYYKGDGTGNCGTGNNWWCELIDYRESTLDYGSYISQDGGVIAYYDSMNMDLKYAVPTSIQQNSCIPVGYWDCRVVDDEDDVGRFVSLVNNGVDPMQLAYYDATNGQIKFAQRVASGGNCGFDSRFACFNVDSVGKPLVPLGISLTLDAEHQPIIAYMNASAEFSASTLDIARPSIVYGGYIGNCGDKWPSPGMLFSYFTCKTIDNGSQYNDEAYFAGVTVSPAGLATIAYYEWDSYYEEGRLKVAQQAFSIYLPLILK